MFCSRLQLSSLLFATSLYYLFKVSNVSLSVLLRHCSVLGFSCLLSTQVFHCFVILCYVTTPFWAPGVSYSVCYVTILSLQGFQCFIVCFITTLLCSRLQLSPLLFVTSLYYFFKVPLLVNCFFTSLLCSRLRLFNLLFVKSLYYLFQVSIVSLSVCYFIALFSA